jgi:hypothetical protein
METTIKVAQLPTINFALSRSSSNSVSGRTNHEIINEQSTATHTVTYPTSHQPSRASGLEKTSWKAECLRRSIRQTIKPVIAMTTLLKVHVLYLKKSTSVSMCAWTCIIDDIDPRFSYFLTRKFTR